MNKVTLTSQESQAHVASVDSRTGKWKRRQTLCDKRDNNFVWNNISPNFTFFKQILL